MDRGREGRRGGTGQRQSEKQGTHIEQRIHGSVELSSRSHLGLELPHLFGRQYRCRAQQLPRLLHLYVALAAGLRGRSAALSSLARLLYTSGKGEGENSVVLTFQRRDGI